MADESNVLPTSQIVRWVAIGVLVLLAVGLYLRDGRKLPPVTAPPAPPVPPASPEPAPEPTGPSAN